MLVKPVQLNSKETKLCSETYYSARASPVLSSVMNVQHYLRSLPQVLEFKNEEKLKQNVFKALYYSLSSNGEFISQLFEGLNNVEYYPWDPHVIDDYPFYENFYNNSSYLHPADKACGRILEEGEWVYRCEDCGYDMTCVICEHCFNSEDHADHSVVMYLSGANEGLCDCGDGTAFLNELHCQCLKRNNEPSELPGAFNEAIHQTITVALDYILDVTNFSVSSLPFINSKLNGEGDFNPRVLSNAGSLPLEKYGDEDLNSLKLWYLLLWNDENHDYPEAEAAIRAVTGVSEKLANKIANAINSNGRAILKKATSYETLLKSKEAAQKDGLVATVCSARDYMREEIVFHIFSWLKEVSSFKGNMSVKDQVKKSIAQLLMEPGYQFINSVPVDMLASTTRDLQRKCFENGLLYDGQLLNLAHVKLRLQEIPPINLTDSLSLLVEVDQDVKLANSRLQYLFAFEVRLPSNTRKLFITTLLPILTSSLDIKREFAEQYIDIFPTLMSIFAFSDREEELASVVQVSLQLFTCPRTNQFIVESGRFVNVLGPGGILMEQHASKPNEDNIPNTIDLVVDIKTKREKSAIQKTTITYMDVTGKILSHNDCEDLLSAILLKNDLYFMLFFLRCFHGLLALTRKYGDHVERESLLDFVTFLQKGIPTLEIVKNAASTTKEVDIEKLKKAIKIVFDFLHSRKPSPSTFKVSKHPVSMLNPVNSLFALLLQKVGDVTDVMRSICGEVQTFRHISEYSLRSMVLASQIKVQLWIRNGVAVSRQAAYYSNAKISQISYLGDFYLNQVALLSEEPESLLKHFVHMWQLEPWAFKIFEPSKIKLYASEDWKPQNSVEENIKVYDDRWGVMCEQFILFLYNLLTNRLFFRNLSGDALFREKTKKRVCDILCQGPKSYSELRKEMQTAIFNNKNFDEILRECADFQPPTGFTDTGIYRLKNKIYDELDPFNTLDSGISQSVYEALISHSKQHNSSPTLDSLIGIKPQFIMSDYLLINDCLGEFTRTKLFAQIVENLLEISITCENEEFLPHLLQLIHASLLDAQNVYGVSYLSSGFRESSIGSALFKLHESSGSSDITKKARLLMEIIMEKDESIVDKLAQEFGEDGVSSLKNNRTVRKPKTSKLLSAAGRNAKIMKKFEAQRRQFLENQHKEIPSLDAASDFDAKDTNTEFARCVACGELQTFEEPFVIPLATTKAWVFCSLPYEDDLFCEAFADSDVFSTRVSDDNTVYSEPLEHMPPGQRSENIVGISCGHGIHLKCLGEDALDGLRSCPLCHNAHEDEIPTYVSERTDQFLSDKVIHGELTPLTGTRSAVKFSDILGTTVHLDYMTKFPRHETRLHPLFYKVNSMLEDDSSELLTETVNDMCFLISDTIRAHEIASRVDGVKSLSNFIQQSSAAFKTQIRSLIQGFAFFCDEFEDSLQSQVFVEPFAKDEVQFDSVFKEVVFTFLQTRFSLITAFRFGFAKLIAIRLIQLCSAYDEQLQVSHQTEITRSLPPKEAKIFRLFCKQLFGKVLDKNMEHTLFPVLERCLLPYLRCCALFYDVALSAKTGDNEYKCHARFEKFASQAEKQTKNSSTDALCDVCEIPRIFDLMALYVDSPNVNQGDIYPKKEMWFEVQMLEMFAQNYGTLYPCITRVEYPNVPRLVELPQSYNEIVTDLNFKDGMDGVCLICGEYLRHNAEKAHMNENRECSSPSLIFYQDNRILVTIVLGHAINRSATIPGPYMTEHGEVAAPKGHGRARLNHARYRQLNKMFINQDLFGYATRSSFGVSRDEMGFADITPPRGMAQAGVTAQILVETFQDALMGEMEDSEGDDSDAWFV